MAAKKLLTAFGETKTLKEWSEDDRCEVSARTLAQRLRSGMSPEEAITKPRRKVNNRASERKVDKPFWGELRTRWRCMKARCYSEDYRDFSKYGAKGVQVCEEWRDSFESYYEWMIDNGYEPGLELDRYPNQIGNYEPGNCRLTSSKENQNNRTNNVMLTVNEKTLSLTEWSRQPECSISFQAIWQRLQAGWCHEDAVLVPPHGQPQHKPTDSGALSGLLQTLPS